MHAFIRKGDSLWEAGGEVLEGHYLCDGQPIACQGDAVRCNLHGLTVIAEGSDLIEIDGCPVALHAHRCACGCSLVSSMPDTLAAS